MEGGKKKRNQGRRQDKSNIKDIELRIGFDIIPRVSIQLRFLLKGKKGEDRKEKK